MYTEIRDMIVFVYEERLFDMTVVMELFIQIYNLFEEETVSAKDVKEAIYWYISDYSDEMVGRRVREGVDPDLDFATNIIMNQDLTDPRYLYRFGEYVTENEIRMSQFLSSMPKEQLEAMARTFTEGYRTGFAATNKDISKQKIRKYLVDNNYIDCIIQLPSNLFFGTSIATCIMVMKKNKADTRPCLLMPQASV